MNDRTLFFYWLTLQLGLKNIHVHRLRSSLTVLGIVFGVFSVICMLSITEGANREALDQIKRLGSQNVIARSVKPPQDDQSASASGGSRGSRQSVEYGLLYADAERLTETIPSVELLVPIKARVDTVRFETREVQATVLGTTPTYDSVANLGLKDGRFISDLDMELSTNVCVLGDHIARRLFLFDDPIGKSLKIGTHAYRVIGLTGTMRGSGEGSDLPSQNADIYVPLATMRAFNGDLFMKTETGSFQSEYYELSEIILRVSDADLVLATAKLVQETLSSHHPKNDFQMTVPLQLLENARRLQAIFSIVLGSIAAISLLVGGIGIMNIMLASVSERTREIGIRRALGARQNDIMHQFLVECMILSLGGGIIGMVLGAIVPQLVTRFSGMPTVLTPWAFIVSFVVSVFVGLVFGLYPARRAAMMDPIDALRHE